MKVNSWFVPFVRSSWFVFHYNAVKRSVNERNEPHTNEIRNNNMIKGSK